MNKLAAADVSVEEILAAVRQALASTDWAGADVAKNAGLDAFHKLAERYERSVHTALAQGDNPELAPDQTAD